MSGKDTWLPILVGGFGEINFGKQYRQGNRVYDSRAIAMALNASPVGNVGGDSYLYLVLDRHGECDDEGNEQFDFRRGD